MPSATGLVPGLRFLLCFHVHFTDVTLHTAKRITQQQDPNVDPPGMGFGVLGGGLFLVGAVLDWRKSRKQY